MIWATLGGVTIGLALLIRHLIAWWPGLKSLQSSPLQHAGALLPFIAAWCYGALAILTVGGLIGWAADTTLWITNWLGDAALVWGVGGQAGVTIRSGVRAGGKNGPGVHADDIPTPLPTSGAPSEACVCAGHAANANANNSGGKGPEKGFRVEHTGQAGVTVYDLSETHSRRHTAKA